MQDEITREYFNRRQEEIYAKWKTKMEQTPCVHENAIHFYNMYKFEMFKDIEELYHIATILGIKGE